VVLNQTFRRNKLFPVKLTKQEFLFLPPGCQGLSFVFFESCDSSVVITTSYGVRFPAEAGYFSSSLSVTPNKCRNRDRSLPSTTSQSIINQHITGRRSWDSSVGIATSYRVDDWGVGVRVPVESRIFSSSRRPDRLCGPSSLLSNGYQGLFPRE
jgi:hypothetical protein